MGFLSEIRKAMFGAKSVAKSQADKTEEYVKQKGSEFKGQAEELGEKAKITAENIWDKLETEADDLWNEISEKDPDKPLTEEEILKAKKREERKEKIKQKADEVWKKTIEVSDDINEEIYEKGEKVWDKTKEVSEKIGDKLLDKGEEVFNKGKSIFDDLSEKAQREWDEEQKRKGKGFDTPGEDMTDKAAEEAGKSNVDDVNTQAHRMSADIQEEVDNIRKSKGKDESLLSGTDDFFERADRFAKGDYHNTGHDDKPKEGETRLIDDVAKPAPNTGRVKGFEDRDGDGDEIIDDAIIDGDDIS